MPEWKDLLAALASLAASFAGAWAAFALESRRRKREEEGKSIGAANRAIYTVFTLWNVLEQYRKEVLEPFRGKPDAWLNLAANPTIPVGDSKFQAGDLQFLLQTTHANIFATLLLEEQRFGLAIDLIRSRSSLVLEEVFPAMAAAGIGVGQPMHQAHVEQALGIDVTHKLKQLTVAIYTNVDEDLVSLRTTYEQFRKVLQELYPKQKFLQVEFQVVPQ
ncbi:hypothetical protein SAMN04244579_00477 [Azotobacter beijerinckii]|uniref:DUF4760 domain-containing protein n=1 Tax=Azotobacter beijerinckii TaxID=170623 RepID=A0A1H6QY04_9GAMM|nr:hypothetical protein [Azotobacter beijerinckii]SEI44145.1 hypothetical protein SAMN04244579_00477 [Azotobacter beijerinckii]